MYRIVFLGCSSLFILGCQPGSTHTPRIIEESIALPYYNTPDFTPLFLTEDVQIEKQITHTIADFAFLNQDSTTITQKNLVGKIHVANFIFTICPSICPKMTDNMKILSDSLKSDTDIALLSYSVTPWIDRPKVLKEYQLNKGIDDPNWHLLTGKKSEIYTLARQSYFAEEDIGFSKDSTEFLHTEHFVLVDADLRIRGIYNGTLSLEMQNLLEDIHALKQE